MPDFPFPVMIFAAGFGTRMGALTKGQPKPLIKVAGRALIDHALTVAEGVGSGRVVVNTHYRADQLAAHLAGRGLQISHEAGQILETGGGLRAALPLLGPGPVAILNSDAIWTGANPLAELAAQWDGTRMEALLLLLPAQQAGAAKGDFLLDDQGRIARSRGGEDLPYLGASILNPARLAEVPEVVFSLNQPWDAMIAAGTAYGLIHQGGWCDVGHPEGIVAAEALLQASA